MNVTCSSIITYISSLCLVRPSLGFDEISTVYSVKGTGCCCCLRLSALCSDCFETAQLIMVVFSTFYGYLDTTTAATVRLADSADSKTLVKKTEKSKKTVVKLFQ